ncbi:MAG TPA: sulfatase, partial [Gemmatimonadales bacterium]|nr:sulfatase [Gemmatimonadales bacterium]
AGLPPAAAGAPNVLLIVLDTVRALNWSLHGYARETTPRLDGWARTGTRFTTALATASWTLPSHASLFTGRFAHELSADWMRPLDRRWPTLAETLAARGYATAGFTANLGYTSRETGVHRGFARYEDYPISVRWTLNCSGLGRTITRSRSVQRLLRRGLGLAGSVKDADQVNAAFLRWLDRRPARRPFFAFLNYIDVHDHLISPTFAGKFGADWGKQPDHRPGARWTEAEARWRVDRYDESLARLDAKVGALLDSLAARGLTEATLVIVTADHGEEFGEHGVISHGHTLYRPSVHVPLVFVRPGQVPAGRAVEMPVSLRDLPATIMDLVGGGEPHPFPGRSLAALWRDPQAADPARPIASTIRRVANQVPWYPASVGDLHAVVLGDLRYIVNVGSRREELYRMTADPLERHDLSATPEGAAALPRFRRVLAALLGTPAAAGRRAQGE